MVAKLFRENTMQIEEFKDISTLLERVIHKYIHMEKLVIDYGNGISLSQPEIQTIMLIGKYPGISVTEIAKRRGITKGTASQMLYKLVDKGLIEKRVSPHSDAQISVFLTGPGQEASQLHDEYHKQKVLPLYQYMSELPKQSVEDFVKIIEKLEESLD
jgi:DNA-binding MarR family transcriptional regulator